MMKTAVDGETTMVVGETANSPIDCEFEFNGLKSSEWFENMKIEDKEFPFLIVLGNSVNILPTKFYTTLTNEYFLRPNKINIPLNSEHVVRGVCEIDCYLQGIRQKCEFHVIDTDVPIMLGLPTSESFKLVNRLPVKRHSLIDSPKWCENVKIKDKEFPFKIVSGSNVNSLPTSLYNILSKEYSLRPAPPVSTISLSGHSVTVKGICEINCCIRDTEQKCDFYVFDYNDNLTPYIMLDLPTSESFGLLNRPLAKRCSHSTTPENADEMSDSETTTLTSKDEPKWYENLKIEDREFPFTIDTSANFNILPSRIFSTLSSEYFVQPIHGMFTSGSGHILCIKGTCKINCCLQGIHQMCEFNIVDTDGAIILGLPASETFQLINRLPTKSCSHFLTVDSMSNTSASDIHGSSSEILGSSSEILNSSSDTPGSSSETLSGANNGDSRKICWHCLTDYEEHDFRPCVCKFRTVHRKCLLKWIDKKQGGYLDKKVKCPQCDESYEIRIPSYGKMASILQKIDHYVFETKLLCLTCGVLIWPVCLFWRFIVENSIFQVLGREEGIEFIQSTNIIVPLTVPIGLFCLQAFQWEEIVLKIWRKYFTKPPLQPECERAKYTSKSWSITSAAFGTIFLPAISSLCGEILFPSVQSNFKRAVLGGCCYFAVKGCFNMFIKQLEFKQLNNRNVLNSKASVKAKKE